MNNALTIGCGEEIMTSRQERDDAVLCGVQDWQEVIRYCKSCQRVKEAKEQWEKELLEKILKLINNWYDNEISVRDFGEWVYTDGLKESIKQLLTAHDEKEKA